MEITTPGVITDQVQAKIDDLFSAILQEQRSISKLKGPDPSKTQILKEQLDEFVKLRGRTFFYNYLSTGRGHGPFTELVDGSVKYDLIEGIGFNLLGHSSPLYIRACLEAAAVDTIMAGNLQPYQDAHLLTKSLLDSVKKSNLKHFWFACSGSFANDMALKIIWQKKAPRYGVLAFQKAFAGRSVATQDITHNEAYREGMPRYLSVKHIPHFDQKDPRNSLKNSLDALNKAWEENPDHYSCIVMELIQGEAGFVYGPRDYYVEIFKWAKEKGLVIWIDEVQTFGRTQELFAFQMLGLDEYVDVVTIAKALQCAGTLYTEELNPKPGLIAGTFVSSIASMKAGIKTLKFLREGNFYGKDGKMSQLEKEFISRLNDLKQGSCQGKIGYVGGVGTMISFEVGDSSKDITDKFIKRLFENGVISFSAGKNPTRVRFLLPVSLTKEHIDQIFQIIEVTAKEVL